MEAHLSALSSSHVRYPTVILTEVVTSLPEGTVPSVALDLHRRSRVLAIGAMVLQKNGQLERGTNMLCTPQSGLVVKNDSPVI